MKNIFLSFIVAALVGLPFATARDATSVRVSLKNQQGKPVTVQKINLPGNFGIGVEPVMNQHKTGGWHVVNLPLTIEGGTKKQGTALPVHYVPSLTVKVHLLFEHQDAHPKDSKPSGVLLSKELKYVNIPVPNKGDKPNLYTNDILAGVFISPADAWKINEAAKGELAGKLVAYAIEASFKGANCLYTDDGKLPSSKVLDKKLEREWNLNGKWWTRDAKSQGAELKAVSETPYAFAFTTLYPEMAPLVATGADAAAAPLGVPTIPGVDSAGTDSADASATGTDSASDSATPSDDSAGVDTSADADDSSTGRKRNKNKRRSRRGSSL